MTKEIYSNYKRIAPKDEQLAENTFVIPTLINRKGLMRCIETIHKYNDRYKIIVIDNSKEGFDECRPLVDLYIKAKRNLGFSKSVNTGIRLADTPFVTVCNDDVEFINKRWFGSIKDYFAKRPNALAIAPASIKEIPSTEESKTGVYDWLPYKEHYTEEEYDYLLEPKLNHKRAYNPESVFEGTMTYCVVFKKEAFDIIGLYDEGFYPGQGEDYDWNIRCYMKKFWIGSVNNSMVYHHWVTTVSKIHTILTREDFAKYRYWTSFKNKWGDANIYGGGVEPDLINQPTIIMDL